MNTNPASSRSPVLTRVRPWIGILIFSVVITSIGLAACSIPNLESPACGDARNTLREFYSLHFGNSMAFTPDDLKVKEKFLTPEFTARLRGSQEGVDPFTTGNSDFPKAFRVSECREISADRTGLKVILFWKDDTRTEEREINVEMAKRGNDWLVDNVLTNP